MEKALRVGIISDVHIGFNGHNDPTYFGKLGKIGYYGDRQAKWWYYTLCWFKNRGVDLILVPGDMANACDYATWSREKSITIAEREVKEFKAIFDKVFENTDTKLFSIYGNHDAVVMTREKENGGDFTPWQNIFGAPYSPVIEKEIGGYTFIGAHWKNEELAAPFIEKACKRAGKRPVFYIQHDCFDGTAPDCEGRSREPINARTFENLVVLTGHTHSSIVNEANIWQPSEKDAPNFTTIDCSTLNYGCCMGRAAEKENLKTKQALYMTVLEDEVNFERLSFWTDEVIAIVF